MRKIEYHCISLIIVLSLTLGLLGTSSVSGAQSDYEVVVNNFLVFVGNKKKIGRKKVKNNVRYT